jgi:hypothetical protein
MNDSRSELIEGQKGVGLTARQERGENWVGFERLVDAVRVLTFYV